MTTEYRIAYFVSPHGYGHASRAAAIMAALQELSLSTQFEIFTQVPRWFFEDSLASPFGYHSLLTDIGLAQKNSLVEDLPETVRRLANVLPFDRTQIEDLAQQVKRLRCHMVICDISPLGIAVAKAAGLPAVLVENFTWDWIYQGYLPGQERPPGFQKPLGSEILDRLPTEARLSPYINELQELFAAADYHIQTEPVCLPQPADLTTAPVSRKSRTSAGETRQKLGLPNQTKVVLLTMGGIPWEYTFLEQLAGQHDFHFIIPGAAERLELRGNLALLPHQSDFYHPDLVTASDAVIGKLGYSTLAEVHHAGIPFGYIARPHFRESEVLAAYIENNISGVAITATQFENGEWLSLLPDLLVLPHLHHDGEANGADQVAQFIAKLTRMS
jgi:hypothetical protein